MKKKKRHLKKTWKLVLIGLVLLLVYPTFWTIKLTVKNYSVSSAFKILIKGIKNDANQSTYSKTLDIAVQDANFNKKYTRNYLEITYYENKNFIKNVNQLIEKGYTNEQINIMYDKLSNQVIKSLLKEGIISDIDTYLSYDNFREQNLKRYLNYFNGDYKQTILYVNIGLDKKFFEDPNVITKFSVDLLANKYNKLSETFVPNNVVEIDSKYVKEGKSYLSKVAKDAFEKMCVDAEKENIYLLSNSAYRSYEQQTNLYDYYLNTYGQSYVDKYVSVPGYSEHQTGLAIDIASKTNSIFEASNEFTWMKENGYKYGFILRYPKDKIDITGYDYEAWHYRYVGIDMAQKIYESGLTLEEYLN